METNELSKKARGGTELLMERLHDAFPDVHHEFQIIPSRVRDLDPERKKIYYVHDLPNDPEVQHLRNGGWQKFDKIVFVSNWQQQMYNLVLGVPYNSGVVIPNSVNLEKRKTENHPKSKIKIVYHSTPHRGLDILADAFARLQKDFKNDIELYVFSSFDLYGWEARDAPYEDLFKRLEDTENIHYSKSVSNDMIRAILPNMNIFAYPSTWVETSCLCLIESMMSNIRCVHSSLGALPETSGMTTEMYTFSEDKEEHKIRLYGKLHRVIREEMNNLGPFPTRLPFQHAVRNHQWRVVKTKWEILFSELY